MKNILVSIFIILTLIATPTYSASNSINTRWSSTELSTEECIQRAEKILKKTGYKNLQKVDETIAGYLDGYDINIPCVSEKKIVFYIVSGESPKIAAALTNNMLNDFNNGL